MRRRRPENYGPARIYRRMAKALRMNTGVRLTAEDVWVLYNLDEAIQAVIENLDEEDYDEPEPPKGGR